MPLLQAIGLFSERLFAQPTPTHPPPSAHTTARLLQSLTKLLFKLKLESLAILSPQHPIEFYPLYETKDFAICIFVLKKGTTMPTHDHPGMTVFTKLISGDMHVKTFELINDSNSYKHAIDPVSGAPLQLQRAHVRMDKTINADSPDSLLTIVPDSGPNMHSFTAVSDCVFIDILGPPYDQNRLCTYFQELSPSGFEKYFPNAKLKIKDATAVSIMEDVVMNASLCENTHTQSTSRSVPSKEMQVEFEDSEQSLSIDHLSHVAPSLYVQQSKKLAEIPPPHLNQVESTAAESLPLNLSQHRSSQQTLHISQDLTDTPSVATTSNSATSTRHSQLCSNLESAHISSSHNSFAPPSSFSQEMGEKGSSVQTLGLDHSRTLLAKTQQPLPSSCSSVTSDMTFITKTPTPLHPARSDIIAQDSDDPTAVWLLEVSCMEYDCYERRYGGEDAVQPLIPLAPPTHTDSSVCSSETLDTNTLLASIPIQPASHLHPTCSNLPSSPSVPFKTLQQNPFMLNGTASKQEFQCQESDGTGLGQSNAAPSSTDMGREVALRRE
ncbi:hypothetical protein QVD99_002548 [Batrachochytrium dendrobatidis]|nr:hypothetical protein QVD99_002548 [Batrachochytrium dendrobatidis]